MLVYMVKVRVVGHVSVCNADEWMRILGTPCVSWFHHYALGLHVFAKKSGNHPGWFHHESYEAAFFLPNVGLALRWILCLHKTLEFFDDVTMDIRVLGRICSINIVVSHPC